jgi:hypothetical protein
MSGSSDASSALDTSGRTAYTAQLSPDQIRWLRRQADKHDTTVDQFLRAIVANAIDGSEAETSSPSRPANDPADGNDDTVLSRLRKAEETLQALQSAGAPDRAPDEDPAPSASTEKGPLSTAAEDPSSNDEDPPSSMFDLAEKTL